MAPAKLGIFRSPLTAARRPFSAQTPACRRLLSINLSTSCLAFLSPATAVSTSLLSLIKSWSRAWLAISLHSSSAVSSLAHNTLWCSARSYSCSSLALPAAQNAALSSTKFFTSFSMRATLPAISSCLAAARSCSLLLAAVVCWAAAAASRAA